MPWIGDIRDGSTDPAMIIKELLPWFLPAVLIPAGASSNPAFLMMYSAYKLNKQGDNIQPWCTLWTARRSNQSILKEIFRRTEYSWKDWWWSWNSNTLATWCEELTHLKRPWCWERLRAGGEGDDRGWNGWKASPTWCLSKLMSLSKLRESVIDREVWHAAVHGFTMNWT